jgi:hypothetical protein
VRGAIAVDALAMPDGWPLDQPVERCRWVNFGEKNSA